MKPFSAQDLADATSGELHGIEPDAQLSAGVVTDSRDVAAGDVYVARRGELADGLDFAPAAIDAGAALIVAE
ncbi:MAG TPA: Mur ligase domain-containing protein, partial [Brevibacterium sp.]|nr:Mur ligase domain-containing protein [Brevibacterium sp.]